MDKIAEVIDKNVSVVSIFDLENKTNNTIGGKTLYEIQAGLHKGLARLIAVFLQEVVVQIDLEGLADLVPTIGVRYDFDDSSKQLIVTGPVADAFVGCHVEVKVTFLENLLEELDELQGQDILTKVIVYFEDARDNFCWLVDVLTWTFDRLLLGSIRGRSPLFSLLRNVRATEKVNLRESIAVSGLKRREPLSLASLGAS